MAVRVLFREDLEPKRALEVLLSARAHAWALPAFAVVYVLFTTAMAPAVVFHLIAGAAWGFPLGLTINLAVFNATASLHFFLARRLGRERVLALLDALGLGKWAGRIATVGLRSAIAIRVLPFPTLVASGSAGISGMRWRDFAVGSLFGALPWIAIYTYFSASLVAGAEGAERRSFLQALAAAVVILLGTALPKLVARLRRNSP